MAPALFWAVPALAALAIVAAVHPRGRRFALNACLGLWIATTLAIIIRS